MSKLNPADVDFLDKMYRYNRNFKEYVNKASRSGLQTKDQVLGAAITRSVCMYFFDLSNGVEDDEPQTSFSVKEEFVPKC